MDIMNKRKVLGILCTIWILSAALAYGPIFTDLYVMKGKSIDLGATITSCDLLPSVGYAIISSCITFWLPCVTMSAIYMRVFIEASRQERAISSERKRLQVCKGNTHSFFFSFFFLTPIPRL